MTQHIFNASGSATAAQLDANFTDLYNVTALFQVSGTSIGINKAPAAFIDAQAGSAASGAVSFDLTNTQSGVTFGINVTGTTFLTGGAGGSLALLGPTTGNVGIAIGQYVAGTGGIQFLTNAAEQARFDSLGHFMIGYTSSQGAYKLQVNSQIFATSSTIATSDARYKQDVVPISGALAMVEALNPVTFAWKSHPIHNFISGRVTGFLAQEVQTALAGTDFIGNLVKSNTAQLPDGTEEQFFGIAEGNLIAVLAAAVKELSAQVTTLAARVTALEH